MKMFDKIFVNAMLKSFKQTGLINEAPDGTIKLDVDKSIEVLEEALKQLKDEKAKQESESRSEHEVSEEDK